MSVIVFVLRHYRRCLGWALLVLTILLSSHTGIWAQKIDSLPPTRPAVIDTVHRRSTADSLATAYATHVADSVAHVNDSLLYTSLKRRMYKHRLTHQLYDLLFRDVYNSQVTGEVAQIEVNPFVPFRGRIIGKIYIQRLGVFGASVYDTTRKAANWLERTGNKLHINTRESVIRRSYLLFGEGDAVDPTVLRDNERLLRRIGIFLDARILVIPRPGSKQFVDVYVVTQDVWSLLPDGGVGGLNSFQLALDQRNFRGLGQQLVNRINYDGNDPYQKLEYLGRYVNPYIGKTFLTGQIDLQLLRFQKLLSAKLFRPFINPDTKWAGQVELGQYWLQNRVLIRPDSLVQFPLNYFYFDTWVGRSFPSPFRLRNPEDRARIVLAARLSTYNYGRRPEVRADTNQLYQDRRTTLFSIGYTQRRYVRDVLIYGFGRTEDVPYGSTISLVGGFERAELGERVYTGINLSRGQYVRKLGYLYGFMSLGTYFGQTGRQQAIFSLISNYFSPLHKTGWGQMRHFFNTNITLGSDRFNNEYVYLNGDRSFGVNSDALIGTKRLLINYENLLFSRINVLGFRVAFITFANLGMVSFPPNSLLSGPLYQGYGIGFRLRNEHLTFNSIQIRLAYYPNLPDNATPFRTTFEGVPVLRFRDFDINSPQVITFQ
ncbi:hypothetical protein [Fibrella aquatilis]|uniref:Uncharacterized protein n=1 Tax=Fibrella aquatilis TaxID=2817059 RepID=A0A939JXL1_9BACT|nr:hypothetical protein [Fibrella aquatilis]MBO0929438.1 hypothetical protein [Fibrella aquatilis]